jgi:uncharacterized protein
MASCCTDVAPSKTSSNPAGPDRRREGRLEPGKHGISFFEAATVFADPLAVYLDDGSGVGTMVPIGTSLRERVLYVVHVERGHRDRIIGARRAAVGERHVCEGGDQP